MVKIAQYAVLLKCGKRPEALKLLLEQEQFLRENKMTFELLEVLQLIKQHYEVDGNAVMAKEYSLLYFTTKDEFINKSRLGKMDEAKLNIELEQTREKIQEMSYHQRLQTIVLWGVVIIALLVIAFLTLAYINSRRSQHKNQLLYERALAMLNAEEEKKAATPAVVRQDGPSEGDLALLKKITQVMETSDEVYNEGFGVSRLAELVGSNAKAVSRIINDNKHCNFNTLLNDYRVKEACRRLLDKEQYGGLTIEAIGRSLGFKSRSNFASVFRGIIGINPSAFQKMSGPPSPAE